MDDTRRPVTPGTDLRSADIVATDLADLCRQPQQQGYSNGQAIDGPKQQFPSLRRVDGATSIPEIVAYQQTAIRVAYFDPGDSAQKDLPLNEIKQVYTCTAISEIMYDASGSGMGEEAARLGADDDVRVLDCSGDAEECTLETKATAPAAEDAPNDTLYAGGLENEGNNGEACNENESHFTRYANGAGPEVIPEEFDQNWCDLPTGHHQGFNSNNNNFYQGLMASTAESTHYQQMAAPPPPPTLDHSYKVFQQQPHSSAECRTDIGAFDYHNYSRQMPPATSPAFVGDLRNPGHQPGRDSFSGQERLPAYIGRIPASYPPQPPMSALPGAGAYHQVQGNVVPPHSQAYGRAHTAPQFQKQDSGFEIGVLNDTGDFQSFTDSPVETFYEPEYDSTCGCCTESTYVPVDSYERNFGEDNSQTLGNSYHGSNGRFSNNCNFFIYNVNNGGNTSCSLCDTSPAPMNPNYTENNNAELYEERAPRSFPTFYKTRPVPIPCATEIRTMLRPFQRFF